jgi:hypothetical protein
MTLAGKIWAVAQQNSKLAAVWAQIDDMGGELPATLETQLDALQNENADTMREVLLGLKDLGNIVEVHETEIARLKERRDILENRYDRLKQWLANSLPTGQKWSDGMHSLSWRKSVAVEVEQEKLPLEYSKVEYKADKVLIKRALESGATIPGARLVERQNLIVK